MKRKSWISELGGGEEDGSKSLSAKMKEKPLIAKLTGVTFILKGDFELMVFLVISAESSSGFLVSLLSPPVLSFYDRDFQDITEVESPVVQNNNERIWKS